MADLTPVSNPNTNPTTTPILDVIVRKRDSLVYKGPAKAVTSANSHGRFDILPHHANFITVIKETLILHLPDTKDKNIPIKNGVLHAADDKVTIYLDTLSEVSQSEEKKLQENIKPTQNEAKTPPQKA